MKRARKSNSVSWAAGVNLCQVKLFLSEDCPSKIGQNSHDHLRVKGALMLRSSTNEFNDLPPGFEGNHFLNHLRDEVFNIPQVNWKCPRQFVFSPNWLVVAGEESSEMQAQKLREMKVLEAVYPRVSAIPPSPSVYLDVEEEDYDDSLTPLIPIIPIEEEESMDVKPELGAAVDTTPTVHSETYPQCVLAKTMPTSSQCITPPTFSSVACGKPSLGISSDQEADLVAASALVAAIMKSTELGSGIDMDLLVKIFNDPIMIQKLINNHRMAATTETTSSNGLPASGLKHATTSIPLSTHMPSGLPSSGLPATPSVSLLMSKHDRPPTPLPMPMPDQPANPAVPLSRSLPDKPAILSVPLPTPTPTPISEIHRPLNRNINHLSNGLQPTLNPQLPKQDTVLASGARQAASLASISSSEPSMAPLPTASVNFKAVGNQARSPESSMPYSASTGSNFSVKEAHPVKDADYYKNLIKQHGADLPDTQVGIHRSNFEDMKPVHNSEGIHGSNFEDTKPVYKIKTGEVKHKMQKPCIYYNSPKGCRNGSNCPYKHDMPCHWGAGNIVGVPSAKRLKSGPEIKWRI